MKITSFSIIRQRGISLNELFCRVKARIWVDNLSLKVKFRGILNIQKRKPLLRSLICIYKYSYPLPLVCWYQVTVVDCFDVLESLNFVGPTKMFGQFPYYFRYLIEQSLHNYWRKRTEILNSANKVSEALMGLMYSHYEISAYYLTLVQHSGICCLC